MILTVYLSEKKDGDIIDRLPDEANRSAIVQAALRLYYDRQDILLELAQAIARIESRIETLVQLLEGD